MAAFHSELSMRLVSDSANGGSGQWVLTDPLLYFGDVVGMVAVPVGFRTDLASVPRWAYYNLFGNVAHKAAVVHDFLIYDGEPREVADAEFLAAMKASGVPAWRRWPMFAAVRLYSIFSGA